MAKTPDAAIPRECPNRPEWAAPVPAIQQGKCMWCSKVLGEWVECEADRG